MRSASVPRIILLVLLFACVIGVQVDYDYAKPLAVSAGQSPWNGETIRLVDLGFHSAVASGFWVSTMPELLDLVFHGRTEFLSDRELVNTIDPKLTYPYAFSVLVLPIVQNDPALVRTALAIGNEGLAKGDPDWRIPYYMGLDYYLELKDLPSAVKYFNIAAQTPGVPQYAERFALNFGINQRTRDRVRNLWETVYQSTNDPATKARAAAYVERMNDLDYLEAAAKAYQGKFGSYPTSTTELVAKGIIPAVPQDPFGFTFIIRSDGSADISLTQLPSYLLSEPKQ